MSYEGKPERAPRARAPYKIQQIRHALHKDRCGTSFVRVSPSLSLPLSSYAGSGLRPPCRSGRTSCAPPSPPRAAGSHSSRATDYIVKSGGGKKRSRRREKEITLRITSYYCREQSRALEGRRGKGRLNNGMHSSQVHIYSTTCTSKAMCTYLRNKCWSRHFVNLNLECVV